MDTDSSDEKVVLAATACLGMMMHESLAVKTKKKKTKSWLRKRQHGHGMLNMVNNELLGDDLVSYNNFLRMSNDKFKELLSLVKVKIEKQDTMMCESISAEVRLQLTLRFLATGDSFRSLMYATRIHESTISRIIPEVTSALFSTLKDKYLKMPNTEEDWSAIATDFFKKWNFPHCCGAIDGRHITFRAPKSDGSFYFNYKGTHSIVLLALVDANYKFIYINVGVNGRVGDAGVFRHSTLGKLLNDNKLGFPPSMPLPGRTMSVPHVIVGDDAFPLLPNLLKPYPQRGLSHDCRVFNYRLSRARRISENAFGILANKFRVLLNPINLNPNKVEAITLACVVLHNYLAEDIESSAPYSSCNESDPLEIINAQGGNKSSNFARAVRDEYKDYFLSTNGSVPWQEDAIQRHNL